MNHLEGLLRQYYEWNGYIVRSNVKVGRLPHGGWTGELDIVAYHPQTKKLIHLEPSMDAHSWHKREERFAKKFAAGIKYIGSEVFPWVDESIPIDQVAVLASSSRRELAGGKVVSIDEMMKAIKTDIIDCGIMVNNAIPEEFDLLRTIQMTVCGYRNVV